MTGAGFDPAFIPGLTPPVSEEPEEVEAADAEAVSEDADAAVEPGEPETAAPGLEAEAGRQEPAADDEEAPEGPVFEASDRRARIVADHRGVRLTLDDQQCEFRWDEIGAVETESPRFGKRFTITVHTPDRRWYPIEIEATARSRFGEWESQLDAVLDAYFEEGAVEDEPEAAESGDAESGDAELGDAEPEAAESKAAESKAAEPEAAEPKAAEPEAAESKAAESKAAEPEAAESKAAEPEAVESKDKHAD